MIKIVGDITNDTIIGSDGNDTLSGGGGDDSIEGRLSSDLISGDDGNDTLFGDGSDDFDGNGDTIYGGLGSDYIFGGGGNDVLYGDSATGASAFDRNDTIRGQFGDDQIHGGAGDDELIGGAGADTIYGGDGHDRLTGGESFFHAVERGKDPSDRFEEARPIQAIADELYGGAGRDGLFGSGLDTLHGGEDDDTVEYRLNLDAGDLVLDNLFGGSGVDRLGAIISVAAGATVRMTFDDFERYDVILSTEAGARSFVDVSATAPLQQQSEWSLGQGADTFVGSATDDWLRDFGGDDSILGGAGNDRISAVDGDDFISGGEGDDRLYGGQGADSILGGAGNDSLYADAAAGGRNVESVSTVDLDDNSDTLDGGDGDDILFIGWQVIRDLIGVSTGTTVVRGGDGFDSLGVGAPVTSLILDAASSIESFAASSQVLEGFSIRGLNGLQGDDLPGLFDFTGVEDSFARTSNYNPFSDSYPHPDFQPPPVSTTSTIGRLGDGNDTLLGSRISDFVGGEGGNDTLWGNNGDDTLFGGAGANSVNGGLGDDAIWVGSGLDTVRAGAGDDTIHVFAPDTTNTDISGEDGVDTVQLEAGVSVFDTRHFIGIENVTVRAVPDSRPAVFRTPEGTDDRLVFAGGASLSDSEDATGQITFDLRDGNDRFELLDTSLTSDFPLEVMLGTGSDYVSFEGVRNPTVPRGRFPDQTADGGDGNDTLIGSRFQDSLVGGDGDDCLIGGDGHDTLIAIGGSDTVLGGKGDDAIEFAGSRRSENNIFLYTAHSLSGGDGDDIFSTRGFVSNTTFQGGDGEDQLRIDGAVFGDFILDAAASIESLGTTRGDLSVNSTDGTGVRVDLSGIELFGTPRIRVSAEGSTVTGSKFDDQIYSGFVATTISGGDGDDFITDIDGKGRIFGGNGTDFLVIDPLRLKPGVTLQLDRAASVEQVNFVDRPLNLTDEDDFVDLSGVEEYFRYVSTSLGGGADTFVGGAGDDIIQAADEARYIDGSGGIDRLFANFSAAAGPIDYRYSETLSPVAPPTTVPGGPIIRGIEAAQVILTSGNDRFVADYLGNLPGSIDGGNGNDTIGHGDGDGTLKGGAGIDLLALDFSRLNGSGASNTGAVRMQRTEGGTSTGNVPSLIEETVSIFAFGKVADGSNSSNRILVSGFERVDITGSVYDDWLVGGRYADTLIGGEGDDRIFAVGGSDSIRGGFGNDQVYGAQRGTFAGGNGGDLLGINLSWAQSVTVRDATDQASVIDGNTPTTWRGFERFNATLSAGDDLFVAAQRENQADTIRGGAGNDTIDGGDGDDSLEGGAGIDLLALDFSRLNGSGASNTGAVRMQRTEGGTSTGNVPSLIEETVSIFAFGKVADGSNSSNRILVSGFERVDITGSVYDDWLVGGRYADTLIGGEGQDSLTANGGKDQLSGGFGDDWINAGAGRDDVSGDQGTDTLLGGGGKDTLSGGVGNDRLDGGDQDDQLFGGKNNDALWGRAGNDFLDGGMGRDNLQGNNGKDTLLGGAGDDTIRGGSGNDSVVGGDGRDAVYLDAGNDVFQDNAQGGVSGRDTVFGGTGNDTLNGGNGNDVFRGQSGADLLKGRVGNDRLEGGDQSDRLEGGDGNDTLVGGKGQDKGFLGKGNDVWIDNSQARSGNDIVVGGNGNDTIQSAAGNDTLTGGAGADHFVLAETLDNVVITDFDTAADGIEMAAALWTGATTQSYLNSLSDTSSGNLVLSLDNGGSITFEGLTSNAGILDTLTFAA